MEASDWITAGIALAALIVAGMSWWSSRTSARASVTSAAASETSAAWETSAGAAVRSADAAEKSANAEQAMLELERQDRAQADRERRVDVWQVRALADAAEFKFLGAEAHHVFFEANVTLEVQRGKSDVQSPMYKGDRMTVVVQDPEGWNRRVTVSWAESATLDAERLSRVFVV